MTKPTYRSRTSETMWWWSRRKSHATRAEWHRIHRTSRNTRWVARDFENWLATHKSCNFSRQVSSIQETQTWTKFCKLHMSRASPHSSTRTRSVSRRAAYSPWRRRHPRWSHTLIFISKLLRQPERQDRKRRGANHREIIESRSESCLATRQSPPTVQNVSQ